MTICTALHTSRGLFDDHCSLVVAPALISGIGHRLRLMVTGSLQPGKEKEPNRTPKKVTSNQLKPTSRRLILVCKT